MNMATNFFIFIFIVMIFISPGKYPQNETIITDKQNIIGCSATAPQSFYTDENGKYIPVMPGWGSHSCHVSVKNDSAQFYFNQGLNMYYSYHWREAF